ncbi:hypothetical protein ABZ930_10480 [Streptomyces sp. NPDC046716]|uniref:hypothetical protein n=1 Tax=Streptomyces sp. NPDC046716 TaxID=3157093 RepID=UPI0033CE38BD
MRRQVIAPERGTEVRSVDRFLVWICPALAVVGAGLGVASLITGDPVRAVWQFLLAVLMVISARAARLRLRRDVGPDGRLR